MTYVVNTGGRYLINSNTAGYASVRRVLDVYALFHLDRKRQIRVSGTDLLRQDQIVGREFFDSRERQTRTSKSPANAGIRIALELKL
jgi:hypothetical protein